MPRTGTTVISYLLDQDPARRSLLHWECVHPVPPATHRTLRTDPRCLKLLAEQRRCCRPSAAKMALPHWEDADGPTEDMFIHNQDFKGLSWDSFLPTHRYAGWLFDEADMSSTYEYQKRYLQVLQSKAPGHVEPENAVAFGAHRRAAEGVPRCAVDLGASRPLQGDRVAVQPMAAAAKDVMNTELMDQTDMGRAARGR